MPEVGDSVLRHVGWAWTRGRADEVCDQLAHHWGRSDRAIAVGANRQAIAHLRALWTSGRRSRRR